MLGTHTCIMNGWTIPMGGCHICRIEREAQSNRWGSMPIIQRLGYKELNKIKLGRLGVKTDKEIYLEELAKIGIKINNTRVEIDNLDDKLFGYLDRMWLFFILYIPIAMFLVGCLLLEVE